MLDNKGRHLSPYKPWDFLDEQREYTVHCPKCGTPTIVTRYGVFMAQPDLPGETLCNCGSCGERFNAIVEYTPCNVICNTGIVSISAKGSEYPSMHYYPKTRAQDEPIVAGKEALKFLKDQGVSEVEYYCPNCNERHKVSIEPILSTHSYGGYDIIAKCPESDHCYNITLEVHKLEYGSAPYMVKASSHFEDDHIVGVINCINYVGERKSVKKMNFT